MIESRELVLVPLSQIKEPSEPVRQKMTEEGLEELKKSIAKRGLLSPISLRKKDQGFEIGEGHRRFLAVKELGWSEIPALVGDRSDDDVNLDRIHENLHREDMSPVEEGKQIKMLHDKFSYTIKEISRLCSKSESWVLSRLDLNEWPDYLLEAIDVGALSVSAARELNAITDDESRRYYTDHAIKSGATRELCAFWRGRWELEKITHDPSSDGHATFDINPPPMEPEIPCNWCDRQYPIRIINHLRVCPECTEALMKGKAIMRQQEHDESRGPGPGVS